MHMKRLLIAALLVSMGTYAGGDGAKVEEPKKANINDPKTWPTLDEWAEQNKLYDGKLSAEILLGYEHSDLDGNGLRAANGLISRTRLTYQSASMEGFDAFVQAQYVGPLNDRYSPEDLRYDPIGDPENFRMHQAYLAYTGYDSHARLGAQEIILDNARFIGNVGWRLNAQSFNAASIANHSISNLTLFYAYTDSINQTDGERNHDRHYHLFNAEYQVAEETKASAFAYLQRNNAGTKEVDTYGLRLWGKTRSINHDFMVATQRDAFYGHVFAELDTGAIDLGAGVEYISGGDDSRDQFQTLNGTAHKFNGWADQFLGTGGGLSGGLVDSYAQVSTEVEKFKLMAVYHYFHTAEKNALGFDDEYGQEIDGLIKYPVCENFDLLAKAAYYHKGKSGVGNFTDDETVFWLRGTLRF